MKFKLVNVGTIKDAEIELGDFTIFLGNPNEISSALRSIYTSLVLLSRKYEKFFEQKFYELLAKAPPTGIDYVISYLQDLMKDGYDICDPKVVEDAVSLASEYEIKGEVNDNCEIRIYENVSKMVDEFLSEVKREIKGDYMKILAKNVNYTDSSAIYINGKEIRELADELNIEKVKGEMAVTSDVRIKYELSEDGILKVELKPNRSKLRLTSLLKLQDESVLSPFLLGVKKYFDSIRVKEDVIYIPSFRISGDCKTKSVYMTDLGEMFISCYPAKELPIQHYIIHLNNLKRGAKNKYVLDLISKLNEGMRETLLPLADAETPALVLIEGANVDLLPVLLSLVRHEYKFVIGVNNESLDKEKVAEQIKFTQKHPPASASEETEKTLKGIKAYRFENGTAIPI